MTTTLHTVNKQGKLLVNSEYVFPNLKCYQLNLVLENIKIFYFYQTEEKKNFPVEKFSDGIWSVVHSHIESAAWALCHCFPCAKHIAGPNCSLYLCVGLKIDRHTCGFCGACTVIFNSRVFFYSFSWCE